MSQERKEVGRKTEKIDVDIELHVNAGSEA